MDGDTQSLVDNELTSRQRLAAFAQSQRGRQVTLALVIGVILLLAIRFIADRASYVTTSDARIAADIIAVSTDISGRITSVEVNEGDTVVEGDVLYTIDDREAAFLLAQYEAEANRLRAEIAREEARTGIATSKAGSEVEARRAGTQSAVATVEAAKSNLETAQREHERARGLFERGLIPQSRYDQTKNALDTAAQDLRRAQADQATAAAQQRTASISGQEVRLIDNDLLILRAQLDQAEARVEAQAVVLEQHTIRSPINGIVDELFYDTGEHSLRGFRMAMLHDPGSVWVSANIKETDIRHIQPGAPVIIKADSAPSADIRGRVARVNETTLAEAAMMPNPNANGVFTKITQRIKVKIEIEPTDVHLRSGTMVTAKIRKQRADNPPAATAE